MPGTIDGPVVQKEPMLFMHDAPRRGFEAGRYLVVKRTGEIIRSSGKMLGTGGHKIFSRYYNLLAETPDSVAHDIAVTTADGKYTSYPTIRDHLPLFSINSVRPAYFRKAAERKFLAAQKKAEDERRAKLEQCANYAQQFEEAKRKLATRPTAAAKKIAFEEKYVPGK